MGRFIAIEGGDGSGKGTHTKLLVEYLSSQGFDVLETDFPRYGQASAYYVEQYLNGAYGGPNDVPAELGSLPYALDRFAARDEIIAHLAKKNSVVVSNRYAASNLAHQGTKLPSPSDRKAFYERTMTTEYDILGIPKPDVNIVLIMPAEHMQINVDKKDARQYTTLKRDIHEADASHLNLAKLGFEELCELYPQEFIPIQCTDAKNDLRPIEEIQEDIKKIVVLAG